MNNEVKKIPETDPKSYGPKKPEILDMFNLGESVISESYNEPNNPLKKLDIINLPRLKFAGISVRYAAQGQADGTNPPLHNLWEEYSTRNIYDILKNIPNGIYSDAVMGIYYDIKDGYFSYAVGVLMNEDAEIPEELMVRAMEPSCAACGWFKYSTDFNIWGVNPHSIVQNFIDEHKAIFPAVKNDSWCAEAYHDELCQRGEECLCYMIV